LSKTIELGNLGVGEESVLLEEVVGIRARYRTSGESVFTQLKNTELPDRALCRDRFSVRNDQQLPAQSSSRIATGSQSVIHTKGGL
jgi:hypothetical protein